MFKRYVPVNEWLVKSVEEPRFRGVMDFLRVLAWPAVPMLVIGVVMLRGQDLWRRAVGLPVGEKRLFVAAATGDCFEAREAMNEGAHVNDRDAWGQPPLVCATLFCQIDMVRTLLRAGASVNETDANGKTSLMIAATKGRSDLVEVLLDGGADPLMADTNGRTARAHAEEAEFYDVADILRAYESEWAKANSLCG
jgi:hypothetical protein